MAFKFYQTRLNTIKHGETRSNSTKEGVQTVKYLVTKQCLMVFGRLTFIVCPGPYECASSLFPAANVTRLHVFARGLEQEVPK